MTLMSAEKVHKPSPCFFPLFPGSLDRNCTDILFLDDAAQLHSKTVTQFQSKKDSPLFEELFSCKER